MLHGECFASYVTSLLVICMMRALAMSMLHLVQSNLVRTISRIEVLDIVLVFLTTGVIEIAGRTEATAINTLIPTYESTRLLSYGVL